MELQSCLLKLNILQFDLDIAELEQNHKIALNKIKELELQIHNDYLENSRIQTIIGCNNVSAAIHIERLHKLINDSNNKIMIKSLQDYINEYYSQLKDVK